jgi:hypothetical protein
MSEFIFSGLFLKAEQRYIFFSFVSSNTNFIVLFVHLNCLYRSHLSNPAFHGLVTSVVLQHKFSLPYGHFPPAVLGVHCETTLTHCCNDLFRYFGTMIYWPLVVRKILWSEGCQIWDFDLFICYTVHYICDKENKMSNITSLIQIQLSVQTSVFSIIHPIFTYVF